MSNMIIKILIISSSNLIFLFGFIAHNYVLGK